MTRSWLNGNKEKFLPKWTFFKNIWSMQSLPYDWKSESEIALPSSASAERNKNVILEVLREKVFAEANVKTFLEVGSGTG